MIQLQIRQESVDQVGDYLERVRQRILVAIRSGMEDAMEGLAATAIEELDEAGIKSRTGRLIEDIGNSPKVTETDEFVRGTVSADRGNLHLGIWLGEGTHHPAVAGGPGGKLYRFTLPDGNTIYSRGHRAFDVKPHPFLNPALEKFKQPIMDIIQARVAEAY